MVPESATLLLDKDWKYVHLLRCNRWRHECCKKLTYITARIASKVNTVASAHILPGDSAMVDQRAWTVSNVSQERQDSPRIEAQYLRTYI